MILLHTQIKVLIMFQFFYANFMFARYMFARYVLTLLRTYYSITVDGGYSNFGDWSECSEDCEGGIQTRNRTCTNPAPANGGADCVGDSIETKECNTFICRKYLYFICFTFTTSTILTIFLKSLLLHSTRRLNPISTLSVQGS